MKQSSASQSLCAIARGRLSAGNDGLFHSTRCGREHFDQWKVTIKLDKAKANTDGTAVIGEARFKANEYHILPGHIYT